LPVNSICAYPHDVVSTHNKQRGTDFLYTVFQMGEPDRARTVLENSFGKAILRYAEKAWVSDDQRYRIALCDLAIYDPEVVQAHHTATPIIAGRYGTLFREFLKKSCSTRPRNVY
jgi:hypothetical protein